METTTETTTNGSGRKRATASKQGNLPKTTKGSKKLRQLHEQYAIAKYEAKAASDRMKELAPEIVELMKAEELESLSADVDYGDEVRRCVTTLATKTKLKTKLDPAEE